MSNWLWNKGFLWTSRRLRQGIIWILQKWIEYKVSIPDINYKFILFFMLFLENATTNNFSLDHFPKKISSLNFLISQTDFILNFHRSPHKFSFSSLPLVWVFISNQKNVKICGEKINKDILKKKILINWKSWAIEEKNRVRSRKSGRAKSFLWQKTH